MSYQQGPQPQWPPQQPQQPQTWYPPNPEWPQSQTGNISPQPPPYGQPQPQWGQQPPQYGQGQQMMFSGQLGQNFIPPQQQPKKSLRWLWITLGIIAGIGILSCGFCAIISSAAKNAANPPAVITSSSSQTPRTNTTSNTNSATIAKVGQAITVSDVSCTLVSVNKLSASAYDQPKPGNEFIVVHVKLVNNGSNEQSYNPLDFHVKSGAGNITDETFTSSYTANNELNFGQLAAGGSAEGDIVFQVPIGDHKAELTWQPNFFGNTTDYAWNLGL